MQVGLTDAERADLIQAVERSMAELGKGEQSASDSTETVTKSPTRPSYAAKIGPTVLNGNRPSLRRRVVRSLIIFCMGVAATLGWQSYGDEAKEMIASSYPQLGWLVPQTVGAETIPEGTSRIAPVTVSDFQELLKSILIDLAALRQSVDQLAAESIAIQRQMASDIAKLQAAERDILDEISSVPAPRPAAAPARKPVPLPSQNGAR
jgi:hypothetical protein